MKKSVPELENFAGTLQELYEIVDDLCGKFSPKARIAFDSGYENMTVTISTPPPKGRK